MQNAAAKSPIFAAPFLFRKREKCSRRRKKLRWNHPQSRLLIRNLLRSLPSFYVENLPAKFGALMETGDFCRTMAASYALTARPQMTSTRAARAENFQKCTSASSPPAGPYEQILARFRQRSAVITMSTA